MAFPFVPVALGLGGALGGILGSKGYNPKVDPGTIERLFGTTATYDETQKLFEMLSNSPIFSQILQGFDIQGQNMQQDLQSRLGKSGVSPNAGIAAVLSSASGQGANFMRGEARAGLYGRAATEASANVRDRMKLYIENELRRAATPTMAQNFGSALSGAAGSGLAAYFEQLARKSGARKVGGGNDTAPGTIIEEDIFG